MKPKLFEKWIAEVCFHKNNPVRVIIEIRFDLRSELFLQYDYEFDLVYLLCLEDDVVEVSLERSSYDIEDETEAIHMDLIIGFLNDCFPAFGSVMIMNR